MEKVYINIRQRRKELKLSQDELAKMVGYTDRSSIAKIETGKVDLQLSMFLKIADALEIEPRTLLGLEEAENE